MSIRFSKETAIGKVLFDWWVRLDDDRGSRAVLRRASTITAVSLTPPYQRLYRRLRGAGWADDTKSYYNDRLAAAIGLLSHVKQNHERALAKSMSQREGAGDRPCVSELRFRRLLESPDLDALFIGLRRVLPLMNHGVNVLGLANDLVHWGDDVKKRWAYSYEWSEKSKN